MCASREIRKQLCTTRERVKNCVHIREIGKQLCMKGWEETFRMKLGG